MDRPFNPIMDHPLTQIMVIEKDLCVCALLAKLDCMKNMEGTAAFDDSHTMELVKAVDEDEESDLLSIGVAFMMEPIRSGRIEMGELASCIFSAPLLMSLSFFIREENEDPISHTMRISQDERARIVNIHDINLRLNKLTSSENPDDFHQLYSELFQEKKILESIYVRKVIEAEEVGQNLN